MSSNRKKNIITFPNITKNKVLNKGKKYSDNLISKNDQSFWVNSHLSHGEEKGRSKQEGKTHAPVQPLAFPSSLSAEKSEEAMSSPVSLPESEPQGHQDKSHYIFISAACALFLMSVFFSFFE